MYMLYIRPLWRIWLGRTKDSSMALVAVKRFRFSQRPLAVRRPWMPWCRDQLGIPGDIRIDIDLMVG